MKIIFFKEDVKLSDCKFQFYHIHAQLIIYYNKKSTYILNYEYHPNDVIYVWYKLLAHRSFYQHTHRIDMSNNFKTNEPSK